MKTSDRDLWDCASPAALVVLLLAELGREPNAVENKTLENYGVSRHGVVEIDYCKKEFERARCLAASV
jgi:hypothetical protein